MTDEPKPPQEPEAAGSECSAVVRPGTWVFAWSNWQRTERTILTLHDRTEVDALNVAKEMGWTPTRWWQFWRWFSGDGYEQRA